MSKCEHDNNGFCTHCWDKPFTCRHGVDGYCFECAAALKPKLTGGSSSYYTVTVDRPTSGGEPYVAECNDIIEALNMEYDVANAFKAAWRIAALRQGKGKPGQDNPTYDAEKVVFFGNRIIERSK